MVEGVQSADAASVWPSISRHIQKALDIVDTGYALSDLLAAIQARDKQLWVINYGQAAAITSIQILPQWKRLVVEYLGGDHMDQWQGEWFSEMDLFAKFHGCKFIEVHGRKGWARIAKQRGDRAETYSVSRKYV